MNAGSRHGWFGKSPRNLQKASDFAGWKILKFNFFKTPGFSLRCDFFFTISPFFKGKHAEFQRRSVKTCYHEFEEAMDMRISSSGPAVQCVITQLWPRISYSGHAMVFKSKPHIQTSSIILNSY